MYVCMFVCSREILVLRFCIFGWTPEDVVWCCVEMNIFVETPESMFSVILAIQ